MTFIDSVSINKTQPAIVPFDLDYQQTIGSPFISFIDLSMINELFGCKKLCNRVTPVACEMGGFPNPRNCSKCVCPGGYGGDRCTERERPNRRKRFSVIELMRMDHAIAFRRSSQLVIDELIRGRYVITENSRPVTLGTMPSIVYPKTRDHFPVLYQMVNKGVGQGVVLEAKDFFILLPDRRELHLIKLDQFATNVSTDTRGSDRSLVFVKDLVRVYSVEPTRAALRDPQTAL
ncbi:hypothetical protein TELCIR_19814 [Teladorsagia circumcincta]|uniref:Peptidase M12A domain-containing protein n=1 Tax=Teladorsagia circumcincta TaxID=45464 RepID=A0A2G9TL70_TELCI|nr:hypothetical protein TELCIR_19814 [Teladorsagia circumcincta]